VNERWETVFGYSREETIGRTALELKFLTVEDRDRLRALGERQSFLRDEEVDVRTKQGEVRHVTMSAERCMNDGEPYNIFLFNDITERKRVERKLRQSEERYHVLVENAHDLIYTHDLEGNYTSINKAIEQVTGYTRGEALGLNVAQLVAPEYREKARRMTALKLAGEPFTSYELEVIAKDGRRVKVEVNSSLVVQDGVPVGVQGIARDVTERKELEEQLRQRRRWRPWASSPAASRTTSTTC
jgi:two-component system, cell cycle sensor histidine kinase and response regulator CckA